MYSVLFSEASVCSGVVNDCYITTYLCGRVFFTATIFLYADKIQCSHLYTKAMNSCKIKN